MIRTSTHRLQTPRELQEVSITLLCNFVAAPEDPEVSRIHSPPSQRISAANQTLSRSLQEEQNMAICENQRFLIANLSFEGFQHNI